MAAGRLSPSSPPSSSARQGQKLVTRACDPCKIRKIKCSGVSPCRSCQTSCIECTFNRIPSIRGPRKLRAKTIGRIARTRQGEDDQTTAGTDRGTSDENVSHLIDLLDVYSTRLFPIWPVLDAGELSASLLAEPHNERAHHIAQAVALATVAQLKLTTPWEGTVSEIERDGQDTSGDLLDSLRVSFFLHIYYENQTAGGTKSLLYLREAITKAQLLRIDREATYTSLPEAEQQLLRRVLWLLFVTERGVAMLHKLPVVLRPNIIFPWSGRIDDRAHVLPAFLKLVHLFWVFDQSGIFEILRNADTDVSSMESLARGCLELLQTKLQDAADEGFGFGGDIEEDGAGNDVQRADMLVTRQWMRAVLWRAALRFGVVVPVMNPVDVAGEFLTLVAKLPMAALESQGPTLEFKTYEIATAVVDAVAGNYFIAAPGRPKEVLAGLHRILSSSRGGNKRLLSLLNSKLAGSNPDLRILAQPASAVIEGAEPLHWIEDRLGMSAFQEGPDYHSLEEQMAQMSWPPLDLGHMMRSPSPLTRMLLESPSEQMLAG